MIIKFHKYLRKRAVYEAKSNLKGDTHIRYITEDLTRGNYSLVQSLTRYKRDNRVNAIWTRDGKIFAKRHAESRPMKIRTSEDINELLGREPRTPPQTQLTRT